MSIIVKRPRYLVELKIYFDDPEEKKPYLRKTIRAISHKQVTFNDEAVFQEAVKYIKEDVRKNYPTHALSNWEERMTRSETELIVPCCCRCYLRIIVESYFIHLEF